MPLTRAVADAREWVRSAEHRVRTLTSASRALPDYLIVGAMKAGTTSLFAYLADHPGVVPARRKEVHYFDTHYDEGENWYRAMFPPRHRLEGAGPPSGDDAALDDGTLGDGRMITGEASPYYLFHPLVPQRAAALVPDARIIVLLRDPVERAWSHYRHEVAAGREKLSFPDAVQAEPDRLAGAEDDIRAGRHTPAATFHRRASYVARGHYAAQLRRWYEHYPREAVLVVCSEEMFAAPDEHFGRIVEFLGLPRETASPFQVHNQGAVSLPDQAEVQTLRAAYADSNADLEQLLGRSFGWSSLP